MLFDKLFGKKEEQVSCSAVILCAGSSERMGINKSMMNLGSMPVIVRTLKVFEACPAVKEIVVVTKLESINDVAEFCKSYGITKVSKILAGGKTRTESALVGVSEVKKSAKLIAIHDGARPLVTSELIERVVNAAHSYRAAVPIIKCVDTLKVVDENGIVKGTVDRSNTYRVQTPQVFEADLIRGALTKAVTKEIALTDDASAMEMMGIACHTVEGDDDNIKLTTPRDISIAATILKERGEYT